MADGNLEEGWTTVHRQFQGHPERLPPAQRELHERTQIKEWESSDGHWSGIGKHPADFTESKKLHHKITVPQDNSLGWGTYGRVEKVTHRTVCLARKWIQPRRGRTIEILREEAHVMERLDHDHIVKLIGTYTFRQRELYLLIWPVAICNLDELLTDLDDLRSGQGDREDITKRLMALGLTDLSAIQGSVRDAASPGSKGKCPLKFLQRIMGCIGQAVTYCHHSNIRHLDLKPTNILLNPERVYLADFGIARDVNDQEKTTTIGHQGTPKWRASEIYDLKDWSMKSADIYSLGLIYLNIATANVSLKAEVERLKRENAGESLGYSERGRNVKRHPNSSSYNGFPVSEPANATNIGVAIPQLSVSSSHSRKDPGDPAHEHADSCSRPELD
ncbi:hypothetical protein K4K55_008334 [Colletotrichum sp. SAR 10_96]|nr:hypothetical protein K4K55_008334 [Colletotrichum sp. SAR 10_96]